MNINQINNTNFNARYIGETTVLKRHYTKYKPQQVSLIEFDISDPNDVWSIKKLIALWGERNMIGRLFSSSRLVGLTTQDGNFEKPSARKIIGLMQLHDDDAKQYLDIPSLQSIPNSRRINLFKNNKFLNQKLQVLRKYKGIGKSLINEAKKIKENKTIRLFSLDNAYPFYISQGFEPLKPGSSLLIYE